MEINLLLIAAVVAAILSAIDLVRSHGQALTSWAVLILSIAIIISGL